MNFFESYVVKSQFKHIGVQGSQKEHQRYYCFFPCVILVSLSISKISVLME